jgi:hypothetical protein
VYVYAYEYICTYGSKYVHIHKYLYIYNPKPEIWKILIHEYEIEWDI